MEGKHPTSEQLAAPIVDALVDVGLIAKNEFDRAVKIAEVEIDVRKATGDY